MEIVEAINPKDNVKEFIEEKFVRNEIEQIKLE